MRHGTTGRAIGLAVLLALGAYTAHAVVAAVDSITGIRTRAIAQQEAR